MTRISQETPRAFREPDPHTTVALLLQGAVHRSHLARRALQADDHPACADAVLSALQIIDTLHGALDPAAGEITQRLQYLYSYAGLRLIEGNGEHDPKPIAEASELLAQIASAWSAIPPDQRHPQALAA